MSEYYRQLLIAKPKDYVPPAGQVQEFLSAMVERGVIPAPVEINILTPSQRTRSGVNPFTGESVVFQMKDRATLSATAEISQAIANLTDYEAQISGIGRPSLPPLPVKFNEPYYVTVRCNTSSTTRSTSFIHEWIDKGMSVPFSGAPCPPEATMGFFTDPNRGPVIQIPDAGCARFWIEFELGKNLFPEVRGRNLNILDGEIVSAAQRVFSIPFVQGYHWG